MAPTPTPAPPEGPYELHVILDRRMQDYLKYSAQLAFKMGDIPKPDLVNLVNLFINWGLSIQKRKWLDKIGYR